MFLVTSEQMREFDQWTMSTLCVPGIVLMDHAGRAVAQMVATLGKDRVVVLCGKGNNGGDGWSCARWLHHSYGVKVLVLSLVHPSQLTREAKTAAEMALACGVHYEVYQPKGGVPQAEVYVDALLGTGVSRPLAGDLHRLVEAVNREDGAIRIAIDVPTGVDASSGEVRGVAFQADVTTAMAYQKIGTAITPGCLFSGEVQVADIGIKAVDESELSRYVTEDAISAWWPTRKPDSHKGTYGRVGVAVGEMTGASALAGLGAARVGAGLVVLAGAPATFQVPYEFVLRSASQAAVRDCRAIVVGPGLGHADFDWAAVVESHEGTGVLDADGLRLLGGDGLRLRQDRWVITPHPKECARILGWTTEQVQAGRMKAALQVAKETQSIVVLKGYHSLIADPSGRLWVNPTGDASLATAGSGDVLAGIIGGLLAQGLAPFEAAATGAWLHGRCGELAGESLSKTSTMASDVVEFIPRAIRLHFDNATGTTQ